MCHQLWAAAVSLLVLGFCRTANPLLLRAAQPNACRGATPRQTELPSTAGGSPPPHLTLLERCWQAKEALPSQVRLRIAVHLTATRPASSSMASGSFARSSTRS